MIVNHKMFCSSVIHSPPKSGEQCLRKKSYCPAIEKANFGVWSKVWMQSREMSLEIEVHAPLVSTLIWEIHQSLPGLTPGWGSSSSHSSKRTDGFGKQLIKIWYKHALFINLRKVTNETPQFFRFKTTGPFWGKECNISGCLLLLIFVALCHLSLLLSQGWCAEGEGQQRQKAGGTGFGCHQALPSFSHYITIRSLSTGLSNHFTIYKFGMVKLAFYILGNIICSHMDGQERVIICRLE